jgi:cytochrome c oxidase assembly protein subunit 19
MSTFGSPGGSQKQGPPRPPEKGSFPLDHDGECTAAMTEYLNCMKKARNDNSVCREQSKRYLECRMDRYINGSDGN